MESQYISLYEWDIIKEAVEKNGMKGLQYHMDDRGILDAAWFMRSLVQDRCSSTFSTRYYPLWLMLVAEGVDYDALSWIFAPKHSTPFSRRGCGIDVNSDYRGVTALILAAAVAPIERANRVVFDLIRLGAKIRVYCVGDIISIGTTPLHAAAMRGDIQTMQLLILAGSDVNVLTAKNVSPIHLAAKNGHLPACKLLVDSGANIKYYGGREDRKQAHIVARQRGHFAVEKYLRSTLDENLDMSYCM